MCTTLSFLSSIENETFIFCLYGLTKNSSELHYMVKIALYGKNEIKIGQ